MDENKREMKALKKTLYAYEIMAKVPGGNQASAPQTAIYHRCQFCTKAFSTLEYQIAHEKRRHPGMRSPLDPVEYLQSKASADNSGNRNLSSKNEEAKPSKELQKVVELIETFTKSMQKQEPVVEAAVTKPQDSEKQEKSELQQEKLRFEKEIQEITVVSTNKATMHQKLEEEMAQLKQDREAFEKLVVSFV